MNAKGSGLCRANSLSRNALLVLCFQAVGVKNASKSVMSRTACLEQWYTSVLISRAKPLVRHKDECCKVRQLPRHTVLQGPAIPDP